MKNFYLTTAIDYANGSPHLGHAYEKILTDVIARAKRLDGYSVHFVTGLDEHGQKVQQGAQKEGILPQDRCDKVAVEFQAMLEKLNISNDDYIRTTQSRHKGVVSSILQNLYDKGEIYNMSNIDFNTNSIQNVGFSPEAIGVAFSLEEGEMTRPIKIDDGIIVLSLNSISQADSLNSYSDYGISLLQANKFTSSLKVDNAVKEFSNIEDLRYKFF